MRENPAALNNQAILLSQESKYNEAIACLKRALVLDQKNELLWYNLGITYRDTGNLEKTKNCLKTAHQLNPDDQDVLEELAIACYKMNDFDQAMEFSMKGLDLNPENPNFWNTVGVVHFNKHEYNDAAEAFETAVIINPYHPEALYNLRDTYKELGNKQGEAECNLKLKTLKYK